MSIDPLFTAAELDTQIAAYKQALLDVASGQSVRLSAGGSDQTLTMADLPEIRNTLAFLQGEKAKTARIPGAQFLPGRVRR